MARMTLFLSKFLQCAPSIRAEPETCEGSDSEYEVPGIAEVEVCPISNSEAMEKSLVWLGHQKEATSVNTATLLHIRELAAQKREMSRKQSSILRFFSR